MIIPFSRIKPDHALAVGSVLEPKIPAFTPTNDFLGKYYPLLASKVETLESAIRKGDLKQLTQEGSEKDSSFDKRFSKIVRDLSGKAGDPDYGEEGASAAVVLAALSKYDLDLERKEREIQINRFDLIIEEFSSEEMQNHLHTARVKGLYDLCIEDHTALKSIEEVRAIGSVEQKKIPAIWQARNELLPTLEAIYDHIADYAVVDETYHALFAEIVAELKPIMVQHYAEQTRKQNDDSQ